MAAINRRLLLLILLRQRLQLRMQGKFKKSVWVRKLLQERLTKGEFYLLIDDMKRFDHIQFFKHFRMMPSKFEELLSFIAPLITKSTYRAIPAAERLCVTLRYLVTGDAQVTIAASYRISPTSIGRMIFECCEAIWLVLLDKGYMKVPSEPNEWMSISEKFKEHWNFPNCVGAIDGKHVIMQAPARSGSMFFNYKKTHSIVLMGVCDSQYRFIMVDVGESGRQSDGSVFANGNVGQAITEDNLNLPKSQILSGTNIQLPFVFVGDEAFPLKKNVMKPYSRSTLNDSRRIYNYRLSRARRVIENAFGICTSRFRIFRRPIIAKVQNVVKVTKAVVMLHNYLLTEEDSYCPPGFADAVSCGRISHGSWRKEKVSSCGLLDVDRIGSNNYTYEAKEVRDILCNYFSSEIGAVSWQWSIINGTV